MDLYIIDKYNLKIKEIIKVSTYTLQYDEETNAKSQIIVPKKIRVNNRDFVVLRDSQIRYTGIIDNAISKKGELQVTLSCLDISNIFDRNVYERDMDTMNQSLEQFIANNISFFFSNSDDDMINISYIKTIVKTNSKINQPTNSKDGIYNFHTFITNAKQANDIFIDYEITKENLVISIENRSQKRVTVDTTVVEVIDYKKVYEVDPVSKISVVCGDTKNIMNWYLKTDRTITNDKNDQNRAEGSISTIYTDEEEKAYEVALNEFKSNRYKHLVEFSIKSDSKLVDTSKLQVGTPILIKTEDDIYESYISSICIKNTSQFISYKSGQIRVDMIDKLKLRKIDSSNKLDRTGGDVKHLTVNGQNILVPTTTRPYNP